MTSRIDRDHTGSAWPASDSLRGAAIANMKNPTPQDFGLTDNDVERLSAVESERQRFCERTERHIFKLCWLAITAVLLLGVTDTLVPHGTGTLPTFAVLLFVPICSIPGLFLTVLAWLFARSAVLQSIDRRSRFSVSKTHSDHVNYVSYVRAKYEYDQWFKLTQREFWARMDGRTFEREVKSLIERSGRRARLVGGKNDGGVDIVMDDDTVVQCKAHKNPVSPAVARELYGAMAHFDARCGIIVSLNGFTNGVSEFVRDKPIRLMDVNDLILMQMRIAG